MISIVGARRLARASQGNKSSPIQPFRPRFDTDNLLITLLRLAIASQGSNPTPIQPFRPRSNTTALLTVHLGTKSCT